MTFTKNCQDLPIKYCLNYGGCILNDQGNKCTYIYNDNYNDSGKKDHSDDSGEKESKNSSKILFSISSIYLFLLLLL